MHTHRIRIDWPPVQNRICELRCQRICDKLIDIEPLRRPLRQNVELADSKNI